MQKSIKILVTGGAGFIGSHLVKRLVNSNYQVSVIDNLSRGSLDNLKEIKNKIKFINKNLTDEAGLKDIFEGHELVFNLAALNTGVHYDEGRTQVMFEENMLLQMIPLRVAAKTKSIKKFIQISSASVYSRDAMENHVPTPENADTDNPEPSKLGYALAKKMGEQLAIWYGENTKLNTVITRFVNVYGENDNSDNMGHFIPVMVKKVLAAKKQITVFGSGQQQRSFIYVEDVINALILLAHKGKNKEIYNVDSNQEYRIRDIVNLIVKNLDKQCLKIKYDLNKPEGSKRRMLDSSKLRQLGWAPQFDFSEGLKRTIQDISLR